MLGEGLRRPRNRRPKVSFPDATVPDAFLQRGQVRLGYVSRNLVYIWVSSAAECLQLRIRAKWADSRKLGHGAFSSDDARLRRRSCFPCLPLCLSGILEVVSVTDGLGWGDEQLLLVKTDLLVRW